MPNEHNRQSITASTSAESTSQTPENDVTPILSHPKQSKIPTVMANYEFRLTLASKVKQDRTFLEKELHERRMKDLKTVIDEEKKLDWIYTNRST